MLYTQHSKNGHNLLAIYSIMQNRVHFHQNQIEQSKARVDMDLDTFLCTIICGERVEYHYIPQQEYQQFPATV